MSTYSSKSSCSKYEMPAGMEDSTWFQCGFYEDTACATPITEYWELLPNCATEFINSGYGFTGDECISLDDEDDSWGFMANSKCSCSLEGPPAHTGSGRMELFIVYYEDEVCTVEMDGDSEVVD